MSREAFDKYRSVVYLLNLDFQWIEELLKIVVSSSYEAIRRTAPPKVKFRLTRKILEKDSLGKLIARYEQVSGNDEFIKELRDIAKDRNFCAHQSFILSLDEQNNTGFLGKEAERLSAIRERSHACVMNLQKELEELVALLHETPNKTVERDAPQSACPSP